MKGNSEELKFLRKDEEAKKRNESSIGVRLKDLAFQRRTEDYLEVIELLSILQNRKIANLPLSTEDWEAIDIAQAYLREVSDPRITSN